jgi:NADH dehydrogenase
MPVFALPGDGSYPVQPVHVEDLARICVDAGNADGDIVIDAAGPETMPFHDLVTLIRAAVNANAAILHVPPPIMAAAARALGLFVRDVVLTGDEIRGLMAGLLVSHAPPLGQIAFSQWLNEHSSSVGRSYANELKRHFNNTPTVE